MLKTIGIVMGKRMSSACVEPTFSSKPDPTRGGPTKKKPVSKDGHRGQKVGVCTGSTLALPGNQPVLGAAHQNIDAIADDTDLNHFCFLY